jgi:AcrR family transcriptional regulator
MASTHTRTGRGSRAPRGGRRERRRLETRERIFHAALELFAERGFMETTVEDITEAADVGKGTFFNYFPTKEHVLATYGAERLANVERALERARTTDGKVLDVVRDLMKDVGGKGPESAALLRAIYAAHASCTDVRKELQQRMDTARRLLGEIFKLAQQRGEMRKDLSAATLARLVQTVFHGVWCSWALHPSGTLHGTAAEIWDMVCAGLRPELAEPQGARG